MLRVYKKIPDVDDKYGDTFPQSSISVGQVHHLATPFSGRFEKIRFTKF